MNAESTTSIAEPPREKLTQKAVTADHPTWCPGCPERFRGAAPKPLVK